MSTETTGFSKEVLEGMIMEAYEDARIAERDCNFRYFPNWNNLTECERKRYSDNYIRVNAISFNGTSYFKPF